MVTWRGAVLRLTIGALLASFVGTANAESAGAPALWTVKSPTARIYLFGTIHIMRPDVVWTTPAIEAALAQSRDLWLEIPNSPLGVDPGAILGKLRSYGVDREHPLSTKISASDLQRVDAVARAEGLPGESSLEPLRPWLVAVMLGSGPGKKTGYSAASGIDETLRNKMTGAGKPVYGFETIDDQLHFLANMAPAAEVAFLHATLAGGSGVGIDQLVSYWRNGDVAEVAKLDAAEHAGDPAFADRILTKRNADWARQLDIRLHGTGTSFVAVGMGHLAGDASLLEDLQKLGYKVQRLE